MKVCFAIFMSGFFLWPVGKVFQYLKERKTKLAAAGKPKSGLKLRASATFMAWLNGVLGIFYTAAAIFRGALEFFLENGYAEAQYFEVKLLFAVIPFVFGCISIFLVYFTFWEWRKRRRSLMGRWFYTVFSAASFVFVYVCYRWYLDLFV